MLSLLLQQCVCADTGISMVSLAIGWLLAQPGVSCLLVGASTPEQARRNAIVTPPRPAPPLPSATSSSHRSRFQIVAYCNLRSHLVLAAVMLLPVSVAWGY